jgi:predicted glycosyltransferase
VAQRFVNRKLRKFDESWVPDIAQTPNLSGKLSEIRTHKNVRFIGLLSRFDKVQIRAEFKYDLGIILSGPAPQPEILLQRILQNLPVSVTQVIILSGNEYPELKVRKDVTIHWKINANDDEFSSSLAASKCIVVRSGYSTLMDLMRLNRSALLIATPGQTEQIYLANRFEEFFGFVVMNQNEISIKAIEVKLKKLKKEAVLRNFENTLEEVVNCFLEKQ